MNATTYGLDVAKGVFQMYWVDAETAEIVNRRFRRDELIGFLAQRPAGRVALEACGSGHWWARKIKALGHEAVLLHASYIRPFVQTNKTDAADAKAIWTAANQPAMRMVAVKTQDQQSMLSLHRMRALLVKFRTMQVNQLRGLLYEFGVTLRGGRLAGLSEIRKRMAQLESELPGMLWIGLQDQLRRIDELDQDIAQIEKQMGNWQKEEAACRAVSEIPGIGRLTAALVATIGDARTFKSGRECCILGPSSTATRYRRHGSTGIDLEAWRHVPAHDVDPWRKVGGIRRQGANALAIKYPGSATSKCRRRGASQQDGAHSMGSPGAR